MDRFFELNHELNFQKLKVIRSEISNECSNRFQELIATLTDRGIQHLDVKTIHQFLLMPKNVFKSKTLVSLKLENVGFETQELVVFLPCLKIMDLEHMHYENVGPLFIEKLISGYPVLEDLTLVQYDFDKYMRLLRVRSQTLKIFCLRSYWRESKTRFSVKIDAAGRKFMTFNGRQFNRIVVKNLSSIVKIDLHTDFNVKFEGIHALKAVDLRKSDFISDFLIGISSVRHMIISSTTLEVLYRYAKLEQIPIFHNLSHLQAAFSGSLLHFLPDFLEHCRNLKNLVLDGVFFLPGDLASGNVPRCLTSTLEYVKIKNLFLKEETGIKLVNYFLENSAIVKNLKPNNSDIIMKLFTSTNLSSKCQISLMDMQQL